jgi:hypothetical protein
MTLNMIYLVSLVIALVQSGQSISLLDALRANHATQFADRLASDPEALALFTSNAVKFVFAPVDNCSVNGHALFRRDVPPDLAYSLTSANNDASAMKHRKRDNSSASILQPIETFLVQNTIRNQSVVPERTDKSVARRLRIRRNWSPNGGSPYVPAGSSASLVEWTTTAAKVTTGYEPNGKESSLAEWTSAGTNTAWSSEKTEISEKFSATAKITATETWTATESVVLRTSTTWFGKTTTAWSFTTTYPTYSTSESIHPTYSLSTPPHSPYSISIPSHPPYSAWTSTYSPCPTSTSTYLTYHTSTSTLTTYATSTFTATHSTTSTSTCVPYTPSVAPTVKLASGLGDRVAILKSHIPYDGGFIELVSK